MLKKLGGTVDLCDSNYQWHQNSYEDYCEHFAEEPLEHYEHECGPAKDQLCNESFCHTSKCQEGPESKMVCHIVNAGMPDDPSTSYQLLSNCANKFGPNPLTTQACVTDEGMMVDCMMNDCRVKACHDSIDPAMLGPICGNNGVWYENPNLYCQANIQANGVIDINPCANCDAFDCCYDHCLDDNGQRYVS